MSKRKVALLLAVVVALGVYIGIQLWWRVLTLRGNLLVAHSEAFGREFEVGDASAPDRLMVALGDSTVQGVGVWAHQNCLVYRTAAAYASKGVRVKVINLGISGARMTDVLHRQLPLIAQKPDVVMVSIGANDATHFTPRSQFTTSLQQLLQGLNALGAQRVLFATTPDMSVVPAILPGLAHLVDYWGRGQNEVLYRIAGGSVAVVDIHQKAPLDRLDDYAADFFHPNEKGYARWSTVFATELP